MASPTRFNAAQIKASALRYTRYAIGQCLNFCWVITDAPRSANLYDANAAWNAATQKHTTGTPPAGAHVFLRGGPHGHIAPSIGGGWVRSTDWPKKGQVGNVQISVIAKAWGMPYRGWAGDYAGHPIPGIGAAAPAPAKPPAKQPGGVGVSGSVLKQGSVSNAVRKLQADLLRVFPSYAAPIKAAGGPITTFGPATTKVVKEFQKRSNLPQSGVVDARTWAALAKSGIKP